MKIKKAKRSWLILILLLILSAFPNSSFSQTPNDTLNLGILESFEAYTGSGGVTNSCGTVTGDIGTHFGIISGFLPPYNGNTYNADASTNQARYDLLRLYIHLNSKFVDYPNALNPFSGPAHGAAFGTGEILVPGVYSIGSAGSIGGALTLDGGGNPNAVFVIKMNGALTVGAGAIVSLTNGAKSSNVFWVIEGAISVAAGAELKGTLFAKAGAIGIGANVILEGRMLTMAGAITMGIGSSATPPPDVEDAKVLLELIKKEKEQLVKEKKIKDEKMIDSFKEEEIPFLIPESWIWCRMQDLCPNISSGSTPPQPFFKEVGIPYLKVYNIRNQKIDFSYKEQFVDIEYHATKLKRSILEPGDVIMNIVGPPLGKVAIIPDNYEEWNCNQAIVFFKPLNKEMSSWLYTFLCAGTFLQFIELIGTAGQDNISVTKSKTIMLPLPPIEEQKAIVEKVNSLMALCDELEAEIEISKTTQEKWMESS
jgi:hypothetical protein